MKRYAIFDLDGTILDSMIIWKHLAADYLRLKGISAPTHLAETVKTMSLQQSASYFVEQFRLSNSVEEVKWEMNQLLEEFYYDHVQLKPFVMEYLQALKDQCVRMCIATASPLNHTVGALRRLQVFSYFDFILTCDEVGVGKEQPAIFLQAANRWGVAPSEIMVYEDTLYAIRTAKAAGFYTIGVYDAAAVEDTEAIKQICNGYITSFNEMGRIN